MISERRISIVAGLACAVPTAGIVALWVAFTLVGGNGFNGRAANAWMYGQGAVALLAALCTPLLATHLCAKWLRAGFPVFVATGAGIVAACCTIMFVLMIGGFLVALLADSLR